ncbi:MAG: 2-oxo acid dehydrogenase subunit E2 [Candidatus Sericytochromatia bacterium]|nr:2-oxo acid dehydrogenase subunit E2 [Candidatus Sericytochromatia bacterium]
MIEVRLPPIGEGIAEGEIVKWIVQKGQQIEAEQPLLEVLTDKAAVEIPAPQGGIVAELLFQEGDLVPVGSVVARLSQGEEVKTHSVAETLSVSSPAVSESSATVSQPQASDVAMATPAVRQKAREKGLELSQVNGTGPFGRILMEDLERHVPGLPASRSDAVIQPISVSAQSAVPPVRSALPAAQEERIPLRGIRRKIAEQMVRSKYTAPDFLYADEADFNELVAWRKELSEWVKPQGVKLTYLPFLIKALISALKAYPTLNASLDEATQELVLKKVYHMGIAAASPQGLLVPVIQNADQLSILDLAREIERLSGAVREGKAKPDELKGSTFTITNIGVIGGLISAPIINYPEVAILGFNKIYQKPVVWQGEIVARWVCTLSLSVDHRVVDGADAAYFLRHMIQLLENPKRLLLA